MFASSSRAVIRTSVGQASAFSTSACARRSVVVELLKDVEGLGHKHDHVEVAAGRMRHNLEPFRLARWIPWKSAKFTPRPWKAPRKRADTAANDLARITQPKVIRRNAEPTPAEVLTGLYSITPVIAFVRRTVSRGSSALHGSITLADVQQRLTEEHGLTPAQVEVSWVDREDGDRMKELGTWSARVKVRGHGREESVIEVEVVGATN